MSPLWETVVRLVLAGSPCRQAGHGAKPEAASPRRGAQSAQDRLFHPGPRLADGGGAGSAGERYARAQRVVPSAGAALQYGRAQNHARPGRRLLSRQPQMKPSILIALPHYRPGWKAGGPTRTIANLVEHLGDEFSFRILTSDRDYGDERAFPGIEADRWRRVGKADVLYMSPARRGVRAFAHALDAHRLRRALPQQLFSSAVHGRAAARLQAGPRAAAPMRDCASRRVCERCASAQAAEKGGVFQDGVRRWALLRTAMAGVERVRGQGYPAPAFPHRQRHRGRGELASGSWRMMPHPHPSRLATGSLFGLCCCRACRG